LDLAPVPELPEVETTRLGIAPFLCGQRIGAVTVREPRLRWPIPQDFVSQVQGQVITTLERRGKYLLLNTARGTILIHLGMSGSLRLAAVDAAIDKHDHIDLQFDGLTLRFRDPRRFGCMLWVTGNAHAHPLLAKLGPEPLSDDFDGTYLYRRARKRSLAVKSYIMDAAVVVGVGNIYANEALFMARIHPLRAASRLSREQCQRLSAAIKEVLTCAIHVGGTTLRDFVNGQGQPGYFRQRLQIYGRTGKPCMRCGRLVREVRVGQRSSCYCDHCQR
jgi:formamidopyrimidine-DNA glycosylase